jgi:arsenite methyltransferase
VTDNEIRQSVRDRYSRIAEKSGGCCGSGCDCGSAAKSEKELFSMVSGEYSALKGYEAEADLGLGCGMPTRHAGLEAGHTVVDLGSGAGNDAFVALKEVGPGGRVIGIDMTPAMVNRARELALKRGAANLEFLQGEIGNIPLPDATADRVLSNCVLNLVPDKAGAFNEIRRILKPGGRFSISDIVLEGELPVGMRRSAELYAGCVAGALQKQEYLRIAAEAGLEDIEIVSEREIEVPDTELAESVDADELARFRSSGARIVSISLTGRRPK